MIDYRDMLKRYINHVGEEEGVYFHDETIFSDEENKLFDKLVKEINEEMKNENI